MVLVLPQPAPASTRLCFVSVVDACFCWGFNSSIRLAKLIFTHLFVDGCSLADRSYNYGFSSALKQQQILSLDLFAIGSTAWMPSAGLRYRDISSIQQRIFVTLRSSASHS